MSHLAMMRAGTNTWVNIGFPSSNQNEHAVDMMAFDDGSGPQLYVTGDPTMGVFQNSPGIVRWNGSVWSGVGGGSQAPRG
ncbi:MAG: hypothetical protein IPJ19_01620 [Planctomycetes bacterium]|nr:hypothetical protein [Planctomycetota bacterium]